jgi:predicted NAD-dependent protein-ADP-ribosyltransferase YbiA (DUF1768 family)
MQICKEVDMKANDEIRFYRANERPYGAFSNLYRREIIFEGDVFATSGWSRTKFDRMRRVLRAKFTQHDDLRELLLDTGDARLVEAATVDNEVNRLWGEVNGVGQNMLGTMLMELRGELRQGLAIESEWPTLVAAE